MIWKYAFYEYDISDCRYNLGDVQLCMFVRLINYMNDTDVVGSNYDITLAVL